MPRIKRIYNLKFLAKFGIVAIVLYPYILFSKPRRAVSLALMRHEHEHVRQIQKSGWLRFYLSYLYYYFAGLIRWRSHRQAYLHNPYEVEARKREMPLKNF